MLLRISRLVTPNHSNNKFLYSTRLLDLRVTHFTPTAIPIHIPFPIAAARRTRPGEGPQLSTRTQSQIEHVFDGEEIEPFRFRLHVRVQYTVPDGSSSAGRWKSDRPEWSTRKVDYILSTSHYITLQYTAYIIIALGYATVNF